MDASHLKACRNLPVREVLAEARSPFLSGGGSASNGYTVVAQALARLGVRHMFGVIGIPVTELASAAQVQTLL